MMSSLQFKKLISHPGWKNEVYVLHSHNASRPIMLGLGCESFFQSENSTPETLSSLQNWLNERKDWTFGFLSYDVKNGIENLNSRHPNHTGFPSIRFVRPMTVIRMVGNHAEILKNASDLSSDMIHALLSENPELPESNAHLELKARISKEAYIDSVNHLLRHIQLGDIYEVNFCQEFFTQQRLDHPYDLWHRLNTLTEAPFAAYVRSNELHLLCASPERFMNKQGKQIISQPIKGTIRRGKNAEEDEHLKKELSQSQKEKSENVMIVDLVRNDLARFAEKGSVTVEELFGIYSFRTVHHMISTVKAIVPERITFTDILRAMFPMGSMTGAPKISAMELIDQYEYSRRGLYSGSVGYLTPDGDFDFNVVIRSLIYNDSLPYLSCSVGSAITSLCEPEKEYEECLLKAEALFRSLRTQEANTTSSDSHMARTAN